MPKIISLPDGREAEFPDEMDNAAIESVLQKQFPVAGGAKQGNGAQSGPAIPENTLGQEAKRQGLLAVRHLLNAAASPAVLIDKVQAKASDAITGKHIGGTLGEDLNARLTGLGLPEAERPIERFTQGVAESAPAFALPGTLGAQSLGNAAIASAQAQPGEEGTQAAIGAAAGAAVPVLGGALKLAGRTGAHILGATTGAGGESVRQAYRNAPGFVENMRGHVEPRTVVDAARQGIQTMRQAAQDEYRINIPYWANDNGAKPPDFEAVSKAYDNLVGSMKFGDQWKIGPSEKATVDEIGNVLRWFESNKALHTVEGFDALKQRLQAIYPESPQMRQAQRAVTTMANSVKDAIIESSPNYKQSMKDYFNRMEQLDEIERSLSLGDRNTIDTALRKLQSLMRNNVNSNFGQRVQSAHALEQMGGANILPQVAGQAMNSWMPRGLQGAFAGGAGVPTAILAPKTLAAAPLMSPRAVGETVRGVGMISNDPRTQAIVEALRRFTPAAARGMNRKNSNE